MSEFLDIAFRGARAMLESVVGTRWSALTFFTLAAVLGAAPAAAEEWSRARIDRLPDSAFAVVEWAADGRKLRHLPHHDETGALDLPHLRAARQRLGQVKWLDPASADAAARHLAEHERELGLR